MSQNMYSTNSSHFIKFIPRDNIHLNLLSSHSFVSNSTLNSSSTYKSDTITNTQYYIWVIFAVIIIILMYIFDITFAIFQWKILINAMTKK